MIYYFVPDADIFGGVKVACQFVELLNAAGARAVVVLPEGAGAPAWFRTTAPFIDAADASARLRASDWLMFSFPPHYRALAHLPGRRVCHCQGTDPALDPVFADSDVLVLTGWAQATAHLRERFGREAVDVGISVSAGFFFDGGEKLDNLAAYMPRRGLRTALRCIAANPGVDFVPIDGLAEADVARVLKRAGIYLATAEGEWFGLPALEAMAAGCLVLSVPVRGGMEYLHDNDNCLMAQPAEMAARLEFISRPAQAVARARLRLNAVATAGAYRLAAQGRRLRRLLATSLRELAE